MFPSDLIIVILEYLFPGCTGMNYIVFHRCNCCKYCTGCFTSLSCTVRHGIFETKLSTSGNLCPDTKQCMCSSEIHIFETRVNVDCSKAQVGQQFRDHLVSHNQSPIRLRLLKNSLRSCRSLHKKYLEIKHLLSFLNAEGGDGLRKNLKLY